MDVIKMINEKYDIDEKHSAVIDLPFEFISEFKVTAIVGGSGTGKSTLLKKWFNVTSTEFEFDSEKSIFEELFNKINDFDKTSQLLFDVGLSSVPVWKNKFTQLSNGEKLRFEIAYKICSGNSIVFVDEFTSMLDRQVAKNLTLKIGKLLDTYNTKLVICTAHYDVLDWIEVDRLIDTTLKKAVSPQKGQPLTLTNWKSIVYQEICGEHLSSITI
jgi:ABC-type lipoprotein export system ATPase subunit